MSLVSSVAGDWTKIMENKSKITSLNKQYNDLLSEEEKLVSEVTKLQEEAESIDNWVKTVAMSFSNYGITEDDVLDNVEVTELIPLAFACVHYINALVNEKLENVLVKKAGKAEEMPAE